MVRTQEQSSPATVMKRTRTVTNGGTRHRHERTRHISHRSRLCLTSLSNTSRSHISSPTLQILGFHAGLVLNRFGLIRNLGDVKVLSELRIFFFKR
ncbi:hypothetical protein P8452_51095 [Trifolium repens]|nr:K efflux antiporter 3, chloroplastic [Trifolium repens]WJX56903.1 hypothetical protein P8452_42517 [Trifolium repens]WJX66545.1 hypothetical protein P8452_51095 [Trifolium repens]